VRLTFQKEALRRILKWGQVAFFASAVLLLGYCGLSLVDAWIFQKRESRELDRLLRDRQVVSQGTPRPGPSAAPEAAPAIAADGLIGRIEIPRLLVSAVVVEGVDKTTLQRAVGHIPGTALPGQAGNVGLAGHRDTFFRSLKDVKIKDEVEFSTLAGNFNYEVESLKVVDPDNVEVLAASGHNVLTLVTCYPFYFVGPAPKRWIVSARQVVR
jgi:sortase A